ncbi:MAG: YhcH/YjgK/YiaL family protein [Betaproteobacteria bacterium]|nr:YhcH/YjgK/YiaL family protein [Betaproteobacteria bacterium]
MPLVPAPRARPLQHLRDTDFTAPPAGNYDRPGQGHLTGDRHEQPPVVDCRPEVHRQYADVQFLVTSREQIGVAVDTGKAGVGEDMLATRRPAVLRRRVIATLTMRPGVTRRSCPATHRPGGAIDGPEPIRQVVLKVRVSLLQQRAAKPVKTMSAGMIDCGAGSAR